MEVNSTTNDYSYPTEAKRKDPVKTLDKDAFLQLFVTQLQNQDPASPQDTSAFISQMAQFTMLEQLTNMNTEITKLKLSQEMGQASALIGHQVKITADSTDSSGSSVINEVSGQVEKVTLTGDTVQVYVNGTAYGLDKVTEIK
ncbi:MAG: Basal-body rod modification protein FlgD [Pelotomaculum sp. PtaB.Bin104]|uniref:Flagellar hook capping protein n=1 Tax=Pelotomaculum isophthalicicum JI TaxID=947010 RepID=A0A9X4H2Z6_9FIRM|nr:flagellar hook capping FlgD N-terminal domain-containing protein [Pelotomaculum isophthalicicum]MDF9409306.1 flagellar hook capping protein [Pelotomaculum isophthalicicum JI]OPX92394.1 MAG: Basal-body rod modification protein FlgD [Pelotomaculum sp. PtaB.Bin104]